MFGSLIRDLERDPIFGAHSRAMSRMMNMGNLFGDFGGGFLGAPMGMGNNMGMGMGMGMDMMPFGMNMGLHQFPGPGFPQMQQMGNQFGGPAFSSTSVMSMQMNGGGEPVVYTASSSTRQVPGGVKETRKTVTDSRTGVKKMSIGRHLGDRGHVVEREENLRTGQREENEELINFDFDEKHNFEREWRNRVHGHGGVERQSITGPSGHHHSHHSSMGHHGASHYTPSVTIEEVDDDEPETPTTQRALPPIPRVHSPNSHSHQAHHRRATKDRRQKERTKKAKKQQHTGQSPQY